MKSLFLRSAGAITFGIGLVAFCGCADDANRATPADHSARMSSPSPSDNGADIPSGDGRAGESFGNIGKTRGNESQSPGSGNGHGGLKEPARDGSGSLPSNMQGGGEPGAK